MSRITFRDDRGSTIPLILGFYLIAFLMVGGAVLVSEVFNRQRDLQSVCDGAAVAAANAVNAPAARSGDIGALLPLLPVQDSVDSYLARDPGRASVRADAELGLENRSVRVTCTSRAKIAFGGLVGRGDGIEQRASATAEGRTG